MHDYLFGLKPLLLGGGKISSTEGNLLRLSLPPTSNTYCDAQLDDYKHLPRNAFKWSPPLTLEIRARASHNSPSGTLGFGFWNDPFAISLGQGGTARRIPAAPQTLWFFFGSNNNDLPLAPGVPGDGWKAASLRSPRIPSMLLAPLAVTAIGLSQVPRLRSWIIQSALNRVNADEALLDVELQEWHHYAIKWNELHATFLVDNHVVLQTDIIPPKPLGFVLWIDNQYAVASPEKGFRFGTTTTHRDEWLEVEILQLSAT